MNKTDLIAAAYDKAHLNTGVSRNQVESIVSAVLDVIQDELAKGGAVQLTGFGKFEAKATAARAGRNPRTGAPIKIPAGRRVSFSPGVPLKEAVGGAR